MIAVLTLCMCVAQPEPISRSAPIRIENHLSVPAFVLWEGNWASVPAKSITEMTGSPVFPEKSPVTTFVAIAKTSAGTSIAAMKATEPIEIVAIDGIVGHCEGLMETELLRSPSVDHGLREIADSLVTTILKDGNLDKLRNGHFVVVGENSVRSVGVSVSIGSQVQYINEFGIVFRRLPAGAFRHASGIGLVTLTRPFFISTTEITEAQYTRVIGQQKRLPDLGDLPVVNVSWTDAKAFCDKLQTDTGLVYDLPTEAQWEYACRGGGPGPFSPAFHGPHQMMWYNGNSGGSLHTVGELAPNLYGLFDMHGNVREWCRDWWSFQPPRGMDPIGPQEGTERVRRGGAYDTPPEWCACDARDSAPPSLRLPYTGFRPVIELHVPPQKPPP
jgi:hypothetical protein